jgi:hypothetical protein
VEIYKWIKLQIVNAFQLNAGLFDIEGGVARANMEAAIYLGRRNAVCPRLGLYEEVLTHQLLRPDFDERLIFAFDNPVPEDLAQLQAIMSAGAVVGAFTRNEWRELAGYEPTEWGKEPLSPSGLIPADMVSVQAQAEIGSQEGQEAPQEAPGQPQEAPAAQEPAPEENVQDTALNGAQIASLLEIINQVVLGTVPPQAGKLVIAASFPTMGEAQINGIVDSLIVKPQPEPQATPAPAPQPAPPEPKVKASEAYAEGLEAGSQIAGQARAKRKLPPEKALTKILQAFFAKQEAHVLSSLHGKAFIPAEEWNKELQDNVSPVMRIMYESGAKKLISQVGLSDDLFTLITPKLHEAIDGWTLKFCESTNNTTNQNIDVAHQELKKQLEEGLLNKETYNYKLTARVKEIFTSASTERAFLIAKTETNRAVTSSQQMCARQRREDEEVDYPERQRLSRMPRDTCEVCRGARPEHHLQREGYLRGRQPSLSSIL